ncbi:hypothetical protein ACKKBF_B39850 [Auxenochlorella protothecoides x Auxenochlorella symbiontica]
MRCIFRKPLGRAGISGCGSHAGSSTPLCPWPGRCSCCPSGSRARGRKRVQVWRTVDPRARIAPPAKPGSRMPRAPAAACRSTGAGVEGRAQRSGRSWALIRQNGHAVLGDRTRMGLTPALCMQAPGPRGT